jgi:hypothetical protein
MAVKAHGSPWCLLQSLQLIGFNLQTVLKWRFYVIGLIPIYIFTNGTVKLMELLCN